jgi:hypothetical protein
MLTKATPSRNGSTPRRRKSQKRFNAFGSFKRGCQRDGDTDASLAAAEEIRLFYLAKERKTQAKIKGPAKNSTFVF